jgi:nicotinamidase-related amidase
MSPALVFIDLQHDFLADDGRLPIERGQAPTVIAAAQKMAELARERGVPVAHVVNVFPRRSIANLFRKFAAVEGSPGTRIDDRCPQPLPEEPTFEKARGDAFHRPGLRQWLEEREVKSLIVAGVFANACVKQTALSALAKGFEVIVVADGVGAGSEKSRLRGLRNIESAGGRVVSIDELLAVLDEGEKGNAA